MKIFKKSRRLYIATASILAQLGSLCIGGGYFFMNSGIYKLEWDSGYYYIGQSQQLKERAYQHKRRLSRGDHENKALQSVFNKYGIFNFIVLEYCEIEKLNEKEQYYLDLYFKNRKCCNNSPTATSVRGFKWSKESKEKLRQRRLGTTQSDEQKEKARQLMLKRYAEGYSPKRMKGKLNGFYKKKHDLITKLIMSQKKQGVYDGGKNPRARLVLNLETGIYYETIREAAFAAGFGSEKTIRNQIIGRKKNNTSFVIA